MLIDLMEDGELVKTIKLEHLPRTGECLSIDNYIFRVSQVNYTLIETDGRCRVVLGVDIF